MEIPAVKRTPTYPFERFLAVFAAAACLFLTIAIWRSVSVRQPMWPLPGFYFVEVSALGIITALSFLLGQRAAPQIAWASTGIYVAFALMGAFSIGLLYAPIALMFGLLAGLATARHEQSFLRGLGIFIVAAILQAAFMYLVIRLLYGAG